MGALTGYVLALCVPMRVWAQDSEPERPRSAHVLDEPVVRADTVGTEGNPKPRPWERKKTFIFESGLAALVGDEDSRWEVSLEAGAMGPIAGSRWGLGASFEPRFSPYSISMGFNFRARRWLSEDVSVDLVPGVFGQGKIHRDQGDKALGVTLRTNLLYRNLIGVFGAVDVMWPLQEEGTESRLRIGIRTGPS